MLHKESIHPSRVEVPSHNPPLPVNARHTPRQNGLLAALPPESFKRLLPHLKRVFLETGTVLHEPGGRLKSVYFPVDSIVSFLHVMDDGAATEVAMVGHEGLVGIALLTGAQTTPSRAMVQSAGCAYRIAPEVLQEEFRRGGPLQDVLLRYTQVLIAQTGQIAVCNRYHTVEQQLCRWLLLSLDRLPSNELIMTQELIANMLGVRREGITVAASKLQSAGLIRYKRGHITVTDRPALERRVCECYAAVRKESDRLLNQAS